MIVLSVIMYHDCKRRHNYAKLTTQLSVPIQMRLNGYQTRSVTDRYKTLNLIMSRYNAGDVPIEGLLIIPPKEVENFFYP